MRPGIYLNIEMKGDISYKNHGVADTFVQTKNDDSRHVDSIYLFAALYKHSLFLLQRCYVYIYIYIYNYSSVFC